MGLQYILTTGNGTTAPKLVRTLVGGALAGKNVVQVWYFI